MELCAAVLVFACMGYRSSASNLCHRATRIFSYFPQPTLVLQAMYARKLNTHSAWLKAWNEAQSPLLMGR